MLAVLGDPQRPGDRPRGEHHLPAENLLPPDAVRRLAWQPPEPATAEAVAGALAGYGARPWQVELTSRPIAGALRSAENTEE